MRAVHAAQGVRMSSDDTHTAALVLVINMMSRYVRQTEPDTVTVAFDAPGRLWRHAVYSEYKSGRRTHGDPDDKGPFSLFKEFLAIIGVNHIERASWEADDIVAALWRKIRITSPEDEVVILSGDKDLLQLVDENTTQIRPGPEDQPVDVLWVQNKYGVPPENLSRIMALIGDKTDNVPGVRGVGPKKAVQMLLEHDWDLEALAMAKRDSGAWTDKDVADAQVSYTLIDLRWDYDREPANGGLLVHEPLRYAVTPAMTPTLEAYLDRYQLATVRSKIDTGTLWRTVPDGSSGALEHAVGNA